MRQVIYSSAAVTPFSEADLTELLARARRKNELLGCTGMLLYHDGSFLQALEGEEHTTEQLLSTIQSDKRHHRLVRLLARDISERHFAEWRMGFVSTKNLPHQLPGYSEYLRLRGTPVESANAASRLLESFRDGRFRSYVTA